MTIAESERLKRELTDKYVVVQEGFPELRRFAGLTGRVKTVNMNGRALVEFDGPVDISWYDIDPACLRVVDAPLPKADKHAEKAEAAAKAAVKPAAKPAAGKSPLEMARSQGAVAKAGAAGEKKLSPLELARQQGAGGAAAAPAKKLSPLEMARQQGAGGKAAAAPAAEAIPVPPAAEAIPVPPAPEPPSPPPVVTPAEPISAAAPVVEAAKAQSTSREQPGSTAEILALARQQGPVKK